MIQKTPFDLKKTPEKPGVYLFLDHKKSPIYIGKAKNIRKRLISHKNSKRERFFHKAYFLKIKILPSEIAALIEEANLIKKYRPKFNTAFKDDKKYFYLSFSQDKFPKPLINHQPKNEFFGPFVDGKNLKKILNLARKFFPFCSCKKLHLRQCLNAQIKRCPGFCCQKIPVNQTQIDIYRKNINQLKKIFTGKSQSLKRELIKQINQAIQKQDYQKAQQLKKQLEGLEIIFSHKNFLENQPRPAVVDLKDLEKVCKTKLKRIEFFDTSMLQGKDRVGAMTVWQNNTFSKKDWRLFKIKDNFAKDDLAMMKEILERRKNHSDWSPADLMIIDGGKNQLKVLKNIFPEIKTAALEKNSQHQPENLLITNPNLKTAQKIKINSLKPELKNFLEDFSEKTHNFAINFHRKKRDQISLK